MDPALVEQISQISEIVNFVESRTDQSSIQETLQMRKDLEQENERMTMMMEEKLDAIQRKKFQVEQEIEKLLEEQEKSNDMLSKVKEERALAMAKDKEADQRLKEAVNRLEKVKQEVEDFKAEMASIEKKAENIPKLKESKELMYKISKLTFDESKRENIIKGFIINPLKEDVSTFQFDTSDKNVSSHFITNYVWDKIGAGVSEEWNKY